MRGFYLNDRAFSVRPNDELCEIHGESRTVMSLDTNLPTEAKVEREREHEEEDPASFDNSYCRQADQTKNDWDSWFGHKFGLRNISAETNTNTW